MKISFLLNKIPWFGKYSGYEYLINVIDKNKISIYNASENKFFKRLIGKIIQIKLKNFKQTTFGIYTGFIFIRQKNNFIKHVLYLENNLNVLNFLNQKNKSLVVGTIHLPISQWKTNDLNLLLNLQHIIILYKEEIDKFKELIPKTTFNFIRHGVNNDFFKPNYNIREKNKILLVGHYLRDFDTLIKVFEEIKKKISSISLHLIIPSLHRKHPALTILKQAKGVYFYENLSDEELLSFYQSSSLLLMPMKDSGANTAIIQAIACALPIVTSDVGGIKSYGGNEIFPVFERDDIKGMVNYSFKLLTEPTLNLETSKRLREYSTEFLDWKMIASQHEKFYREIYMK